MSIGIIGKKSGMSRVFMEDGSSIPVTVISAENNRVTQKKSDCTDGYNAIQVTTGACKKKHLNKALAGHYSKANVDAGRGLWEFRIDQDEIIGGTGTTAVNLGAEITVDIFTQDQYVDIRGTSKGKGFEGVIKRYNFSSQDATHGNSLSHRAPGSIGQNQSPGRVFKGKKMAGQLGNTNVTTQNLKIVRIDAERKLILVKGAVPGAIGSYVIIKPAKKKKFNKQA